MERKNLISEVAEKENVEQTRNYLNKYRSLTEIERNCLCNVIGMVVTDHGRIRSMWTILYAQTAQKYQLDQIEKVVDKAIGKILKEDSEIRELFCKNSGRKSNKEVIEYFAKKVMAKKLRN
ncbi:MAG: hypothetical protein HFJ34_03110 [Clostridia bacterium]|nr:hypothetical protein [Clostridia bacterium]